MENILINKQVVIEKVFDHKGCRAAFALLCLSMIFIKIDRLFFFLVCIGTPHVIIGLYREYSKKEKLNSIFLLALFLNLVIATALVFISKKLFVYITFFRFILHFFEDKKFNYNISNTYLSIVIGLLIFSLDVINTQYEILFTTSFCVLFYVLYSYRKISLLKTISSFYFIYPLFINAPLFFNLKFDSSSWSFNIAIMHSFFWMTYDSFNKLGEFTPMSSKAVLLSIFFLLFFASLISIEAITFQNFFSFFFYPFYFLSFLHIFSNDQIRLLSLVRFKK